MFAFHDSTAGRWLRNAAAVVVTAAAVASFVHPVHATQETGCGEQLGARCTSSTYPGGEWASSCGGYGCNTCWDSAGNSCDGGYGQTLSGYSANKPGN